MTSEISKKRLFTASSIALITTSMTFALMSYTSGTSIFISATIFSIGICYFRPTMLSFAAEKIPQGGALGLSIMGAVGMLSVSIVLPMIGSFMDVDKSGADTLRMMAILPAILVIAFGLLSFRIPFKKANHSNLRKVF